MKFAFKHGYTFDGRRHVEQSCGYKTDLTIDDHRARFLRNGIARRVVEIYPRATWSGHIQVSSDPDPAVSTPFEEDIDSLVRRLKLWQVFLRADIQSALGQFSTILIGTADGELGTELPRGSSPDNIVYLRVYPEDRSKIASWDEDPRSPRYGLPLTYNLSTRFGRHSESHKPCHWSRVIHFTEDPLDNDVMSAPALESVWNRFDDLDKIVSGGAEASWRRADPGLHVDIDPDVEVTPELEQKLQDQADEYINKLRRIIKTQGADVQELVSNVTNFSQNGQFVLQLIGGGRRIPYRLLLGNEAGELASSQDIETFNSNVDLRRDHVGEPHIRQLVDRLVDYGYVTPPGNDNYTVDWPDADEASEKDKADIVDRLAKANKASVEAGDTVIITSNEIRDSVLGLDPLEDISSQPDGVDILSALSEDAIYRLLSSHWFGVNLEGVSSTTMMVGEVERQLTANHDDLRDDIENEILRSLETGARRGRTELRRLKSKQPGLPRVTSLVDMAFDITNPHARAYAASQAAALIRDLDEITLLGIRQLLSSAYTQGMTVDQIARQITLSVGLRPDQIDAVNNLAAEIRSANPGTIIKRFPPRSGIRDVAGLRIRVPKTGITDDFVRSRVDRYTSMQRNLRGKTIARTLTARASNEGQRQLWGQAQERNLLPADQERYWITTPDERLRDSHALMLGQRRRINEPFTNPDGREIEPGEETDCRCTQGLVVDR